MLRETLLLLVIATAAYAQVTINRDDARDGSAAYYPLGRRLVLTCSVVEPYRVIGWQRLNESDRILQQRVSGDAVSKTLTFDRLNEADGGEYTCVAENNSGQRFINTTYVNVVSGNVLRGVDTKTEKRTKEARIYCNQTLNPPLPLSWYFKNQTSDEWVLVTDGTIDAKDKYALVIKNPTEVKMGRYQCRLNTTGYAGLDTLEMRTGPPIYADSNFYSAPHVKFEETGKSKSITKEENFEFNCVATGIPAPQIRWYQLPEDGNMTQLIPVFRNLENPEEKMPDYGWRDYENGETKIDKHFTYNTTYNPENRHETRSKFVINRAQSDDRRNYICIAENDYGSNNATMLLRVKDKLAALWPFLGIVAEVIILCVIIFIYEKRRSKHVEDEDETEPMRADNSAVDASRDMSLRNRKA